MFQKRDGGTIHSILEEGGTIASKQDAELLLKTMGEIQIDNR